MLAHFETVFEHAAPAIRNRASSANVGLSTGALGLLRYQLLTAAAAAALLEAGRHGCEPRDDLPSSRRFPVETSVADGRRRRRPVSE
jgi:hypothetical protein